VKEEGLKFLKLGLDGMIREAFGFCKEFLN
jgi:hypothetical protein